MLLDPAASGLTPSVPESVSDDKFVDVEVNQQLCLEESGHWLENVDQNHLVLASGKPELQKMRYRIRVHQNRSKK